jgi:hypothetical protein
MLSSVFLDLHPFLGFLFSVSPSYPFALILLHPARYSLSYALYPMPYMGKESYMGKRSYMDAFQGTLLNILIIDTK